MKGAQQIDGFNCGAKVLQEIALFAFGTPITYVASREIMDSFRKHLLWALRNKAVLGVEPIVLVAEEDDVVIVDQAEGQAALRRQVARQNRDNARANFIKDANISAEDYDRMTRVELDVEQQERIMEKNNYVQPEVIDLC